MAPKTPLSKENVGSKYQPGYLHTMISLVLQQETLMPLEILRINREATKELIGVTLFSTVY